VPGEGYYLTITLGFMLCLIMIPISFFVIKWSVWVFILGTLMFLAAGVFSPPASEKAYLEETGEYQSRETRDQKEIYDSLLSRYMKGQ
jgi:hypothetical protein